MIAARPARTAALVAAASCAAVTLVACESSQDKAARIEAASAGQAAATGKGVKVDQVNPDVEVVGSGVVSDSTGAAVAIRLRNDSAEPQYSLPIEMRVEDSAGRAVYTNTDPGLEAVLTRVPYVPARGEVWWVNEQVALAGDGARVVAKVGRQKGAPASGSFELSGLRSAPDPAGGFAVSGIVRDSSGSEASNVFVSIVAARSGRPVAIGKALVEKVAASGGSRFNVILIGKPGGAPLEGSAATLGGGT